MSDFHHNTGNGFLYWIFWCVAFVYSKATGISHWIGSKLPDEIEIPTHDVGYLPELHDLIPSLILAAACAVFSLAVTSAIKWLWFKIFPSTK